MIDVNNGAPRRATVPFGENMVPSRHADESAINLLVCPNCGPSHGHIALCFMNDRPSNTRGTFVALTAQQGREYAAAMLQMCDELDNGSGKS